MLDSRSDMPLTSGERADYLRYKNNIKNGLEQAIVGVRAIRDRRLYREEFKTFEAFCQAILEKPRQEINAQIRVYETRQVLEEISSKIEHDSWAEALNSLPDPLDKKAAILIAYDAAPKAIASGRPTAALIEESVATVKEIKATAGKVDLGNGRMSAATASVVIKHNQRVKDAIQDSQEKRGTSTGTVILIAKHEPCRIVAASAKRYRITFEFDDYATYQKLLKMLQESSNKNLEMKLTQTVPKEVQS